MRQLAGVVGALLTPFDEAGQIDLGRAQAEGDFLASHCDAVSVLGAEVSEYRCLTAGVRRDFLRQMLEQLHGRVSTIAGASATTVSEVIELAELAHDAGADCVQMLLPNRPSGGTPDDAELVRLVEQVAGRSPLPLVLYHHPGQGADPSLSALVDACAVDGVVALKDSSRNISRNLRAVEVIQHAGHASYLATIQPMLAVLLSGGAGAMMPPPLTLVGAQIRDAVAAGDLGRAGALQRLVAIFPAQWAAYGLMAPAKVAMAAVGVPVGDPFQPYAAVPAAEAAQIKKTVEGWSELIGIPAAQAQAS